MNPAIPVLSLKSVSLVYRSGTALFFKKTRHVVFHDISFDLYRGDSLAVIGRNGAGKSSLLRLLSGIVQPDSGEIIRQDVKTSLLSLNIGFDPNVSGKHNAVMAGIMMGLSRKEIESKLEQVFEYAELFDYMDMPLKNYSTGMRARLSFSIAIFVKSDVLLVDEILAVGDERFRAKSKATMAEKLKSGDTIVLVSHNLNDIADLCTKAVWIEEGVTRMYGDAADVVSEYRQYMASTK